MTGILLARAQQRDTVAPLNCNRILIATRWRKYAGPGNTKIDLHVVRASTRWQKLIVMYVNDPLLGTGTCGCRTKLIDDVTVSE